jgi:hypothetical protein
MKKSISPIARKENLVTQELEGEVLVYDLNTNKAICLNETSALVWQLCSGDKSVSEISESISQKLNSPVDDDLVWLALDQLKNEKLITNEEEVVIDYNGISRREMIRKVGFASLVALPLIVSLAIPVAAQNTSCRPNAVGCIPTSGGNSNVCTRNNDCCSCRCTSAGNCIGN